MTPEMFRTMTLEKRKMRLWSSRSTAVKQYLLHRENLPAHRQAFCSSERRLAAPVRKINMAAEQKLDYSSFSHTDLLARVSELEARIRDLNIKHSTPATPSPKLLKKKPKKAPKTFDPSRYHTRHIALKFAYLGGNYNGFEHHSNNTTPLPTIEEELWKALRKTKLIFPDFSKVGGDESEVCWDGVEYSKCGRTDKGVSAFGQVVGLRVRSSQPKAKVKTPEVLIDVGGAAAGDDSPMADAAVAGADGVQPEVDASDVPSATVWDPILDELPYIQHLNRVLPPSIRILAWCPTLPPNFSARFSCRERWYRYFFTNPAYATAPGSSEGTLDIEAMKQAAKKLEGLHDFRNFCKVDPSKQISNFERRVFSAGIHEVRPNAPEGAEPRLYYFEVRGSAFLWHQVRHLVAILFLVGQGYENSSIVDKLLDTQTCPSKPVYDMADDRPLVLWDCIFPNLDKHAAQQQDHVTNGDRHPSYEDALDWVHVGDKVGGRDPAKRAVAGVDDGRFGRNGIMDDLWSQWRQTKIDEVLASSLMDVVAQQGRRPEPAVVNGDAASAISDADRSDRVFDGSDRPRTVGRYIPIMQRERMEAPEMVNARYAARKGLTPRSNGGAEVDMDE